MGLKELDEEITKYENERSHARNNIRQKRMKSNDRQSKPKKAI